MSTFHWPRAAGALALSLALTACDLALAGPRAAPAPAPAVMARSRPATDQAPGALAVFYGWPSLVEGSAGSTDSASRVFARYRAVVLGDGLQDPSHPDHDKTAAIVASLAAGGAGTQVFGYVTLGVTTASLPMVEVRRRVDAWKAVGAAGIFLDEAGYDYGVSRARQNDAVRHVHAAGLGAFVNAWNPDDVFGTAADPAYNPTGAAPLLDARDVYLLESYQIGMSAYESAATWVSRSALAASYRRQYGVRVAAVTTVSAAQPAFDQGKLDYAWQSARLYGVDLFGWGEPWFSAADSRLPFRVRPTLDVSGGRTDVVHDGDLHRRSFKEGVLEVNTGSHTGAFHPATVTRK
jgi:hypothetical protein